MFTFANIRYQLVPFIAPASPALVSGVSLYNELLSNDWHIGMSFVAAVMLGVTIELSGGFMAKGFTDFWSRGSWLRMLISGLGLLIYTAVAASFVWGTWGLVGVSFLTLFLYLVIAAQDTFQDTRKLESERDVLELELSKQKTEQARQDASAERAKARVASGSGQLSTFSTFQPKNGGKYGKLETFLDGFESPDKVTLKEIMQVTGLSQTTAHRYKNKYMQLKNRD